MSRRKGLHFYQKKKKINRDLLREIAVYLFCILVAIFLAGVLVFCVGIKTSVIGNSMEPTLNNGQEILINRVVYTITSPKRGDVVVFLPNGNTNAHYYVKRVVGLPGETIQIIGGKIYIDGQMFADDRYDKIADPGIAENPILLRDDEYFVIGDNINSSEDSRSANIGPVHKDDIFGKAWFHMSSEEDGMGFVR